MESLVRRLKIDEGIFYLPEKDTEGVWTIGHGHNMNMPFSARVCVQLLSNGILHIPITRDLAHQILEDDIEIALNELDGVRPFWRALPHASRVVIASMQFQMGTGRVGTFVKFWKAIQQRNYVAAAEEMKDSLWYVQTTNRAERLRKLMLSAVQSVEV